MRPVDLAREHGLSAQAIRNYEDAGILPAADRGETGYRRYTPLHAQALRTFLALRGGHGHQQATEIMRAINQDETEAAYRLIDAAHTALLTERDTRAESAAALGSLTGMTAFGLTPYIGAGVGVAGLTTRGSFQTADGTVTPVGTHDDYQLAWAAMAGVSYHVSPHLLLDIGYRYLDLGTYRAPQGTTVVAGQTPYKFYNGNSTDLTSHEVRVGVRYQID